MAFALTDTERRQYSARGVRPEIVWRDWEVTDKTPETEDVVTFGSGGFVTGPCGPRCRAGT
jgi:nitric oxide dioxygenase